MQGFVGGDVQVAFDTVTAIMPQARAGKVRVLAITSKDRSATAPDVAPLAESGVPGFDVSTWFAFFVPTGTPRAAIDRINGEVVRIMQSKDMSERLQGMGMKRGGKLARATRRPCQQ